MSLAIQTASLATRIGTEFKTVRAEFLAVTGTLGSLTTTNKTNLVAAINEVKASATGSPPDATVTTKGVVELATDAETTAGVDTVRAVTPSNISAAFTARIDTNTALGTSNTLVPSQNAVKAYADALIGANDAMVFKGVIDASTNPNYPASNRGDTYRISVAGKIGGASGPNVEVGDLIIALTDATVAGTQAAVGANWNITQSNIDGAVTGPTSSTSGNLPSFSGTTGKVIADSGFTPSNAAVGTGSATILPTTSAVKTYVDTGVGTAALKANNLSDLANVATARTNLGLGTAATTASTAYDAAGAATTAQANAIAVSAQRASNLSDLANAATARTNLGLGTAATSAATAFEPSGAAAAAQSAAIAASQPRDADLTAIAALTSAADKVPYSTAADTWAMASFTSAGRAVVGAVDAAAQRTVIDVYSKAEIGNPEQDLVAAFNAAIV